MLEIREESLAHPGEHGRAERTGMPRQLDGLALFETRPLWVVVAPKLAQLRPKTPASNP